jgi:outer membrane protein insertion porin family
MQARALPIILFASLVSTTGLSAQAPASRLRTPSILPISAIAVTGNKTLKTEAILAVSGLKINDNGGPAVFDAASDRLLATGYFDTVSYTFRQQNLGFSITFAVTEMKQVYPLYVEALPITPEQVTQLLKSKDPLFTGLLPGTKQVIDRAAAAVEQYIASTNPGLRVRAKVILSGPEHYEIQLAPAEGLPVIADVTFEGSALIKDSELHEVMIRNGIGQVFSDASIRALLDRFIRPLFEKQGYMGVTFPKITSKPAAGVKGIDVHVTVADGPRFKLGAVSVRGPAAADSKRILRMANLPSSDFANGDDLLQGATRIHDVLRGEGYLDVTVSTDHTVNGATMTADAWFEVNPGVVYTFGRLEVLGLGLDGEAAIRKLWSVKPGDPFPGGYPDHFVQTVKEEGLFDNLGAITASPSINRQTRVVDVSLHFSSGPGLGQRPRAQF